MKRNCRFVLHALVIGMVVPMLLFFICLSTFFLAVVSWATFAHIRSCPPLSSSSPFLFCSSLSSSSAQISLVPSSLSPFNPPTHPSMTMDENKKKKKNQPNKSQFFSFPSVPPFLAIAPYCSIFFSPPFPLSLSHFAL